MNHPSHPIVAVRKLSKVSNLPPDQTFHDSPPGTGGDGEPGEPGR